MQIDWQHVYLLGWHSCNGKRNLTTWQNNKRPWIDVVVRASEDDMPHIMWASPLHGNFELKLIPPLTNCQAYAKINSGIHAFGWYIEEGINRPAMRALTDPWDWYYKLKGKQNGKS